MRLETINSVASAAGSVLLLSDGHGSGSVFALESLNFSGNSVEVLLGLSRTKVLSTTDINTIVDDLSICI